MKNEQLIPSSFKELLGGQFHPAKGGQLHRLLHINDDHALKNISSETLTTR